MYRAQAVNFYRDSGTRPYCTLRRDRKIQTAEELDAVMKEPKGVATTRNIWIHESLEDEARRMWEAGR
jgi:hypothetical protein